MLAAPGIIGEDDRDALLAGPRRRFAAELQAGAFPFAPDDEDIHMAIERRLTELAGRPRQAAHRALPQRPGRDRRRLYARDHLGRARRRPRAHARSRRRPRRHSTGDAGLHPPAARAARLPLPPPARVFLDARPRPRALPLRRGGDRDAPARRRRARGRQLETDRVMVAERARLRRRVARTRSTRSPTATSPSTTQRRRDCATHLSRLGAEIVIWTSEEFGFVELPRRWSHRLVDHAAEEEPRRGRAAARQGAADRRAPRARSTA